MTQTRPVLHAEVRTVLGKQVKRLRKEGRVPAVVHQPGQESQHITLRTNEFLSVYSQVGTSGIIELHVKGGRPIHTLCRQVERDPISGQVRHVVLRHIRMTEKVTVEIPLHFVGEAPAARAFGGAVLTLRDHVRVEARPADLVPSIEVDLSMLEMLEDKITFGDLPIPSTLEIVDDPEEVVATVAPPKLYVPEEEITEEAVEEEKPAVEMGESEGASGRAG